MTLEGSKEADRQIIISEAMAKLTPNFQFLPSEMRDVKTRKPIEWSTHLTKFGRMLQNLWQNLAFVVNGQIGFGDGTHPDNINGVWASVADTGNANTDFTVVHNLQRVPVGYLVMTASIATDVYTGSVAATKTNLTLRSSAAHAALSLFIL
jgi:hypothetical protein